MKIHLLKRTKRSIRLFATGFAMGITDLIPGVSGGTIAFVSGIYEELIYTIKTVTGKTIDHALKLEFKQSIQSIPWAFLVPLLLGMVTAIFSMAGVLNSLLESHEKLVWSFFFGLVISSVYIVMKRVVKWDWSDIITFIIAGTLTFLLMGLRPTEVSNSLPILFLSGTIAICAMILPGISGSFILVLFGKYQFLLDAISDRRVVVIGVFGLGCAFGLVLFSRVLNWLFTKHHDTSVTLIAGFMIGSLRAIWPFENSYSVSDDQNLYAYGLIALGISAILLLAKLDGLKEQTGDVHDKAFEKEHKHALEIEK